MRVSSSTYSNQTFKVLRNLNFQRKKLLIAVNLSRDHIQLHRTVDSVELERFNSSEVNRGIHNSIRCLKSLQSELEYLQASTTSLGNSRQCFTTLPSLGLKPLPPFCPITSHPSEESAPFLFKPHLSTERL